MLQSLTSLNLSWLNVCPSQRAYSITSAKVLQAHTALLICLHLQRYGANDVAADVHRPIADFRFLHKHCSQILYKEVFPLQYNETRGMNRRCAGEGKLQQEGGGVKKRQERLLGRETRPPRVFRKLYSFLNLSNEYYT